MNSESTGIRVWKNLSGIFHNIIVFDGSVILYAKAENDQLDSVAQAIEGGQVPEGFKAKSIALSSATKVIFNRHDDSATVHFGQGKESKSHELDFATGDERDGFCKLIGDTKGWSASEVKHNIVTACVKPVVGIGIVGGLTALLYFMAQDLAAGNEPDTTGRRGLLKTLVAWVVDLIGSTGVLVVGGLLVVCMILWLVARVKTPPIMVTYKSRG